MCLNSSRLLKSLWTPGIGIQNHLSGQLPWIRSWRNCDGAGKPSKTSSRGAPCRVHEKGGKNNSSRLGDTTLADSSVIYVRGLFSDFKDSGRRWAYTLSDTSPVNTNPANGPNSPGFNTEIRAAHYQVASLLFGGNHVFTKYYANSSGQYDLASLYAAGRGVQLDYVSAYVWYSLAASSGEERSARQLKSLSKRMTPRQMQQAQARLDDQNRPGKPVDGPEAAGLVTIPLPAQK